MVAMNYFLCPNESLIPCFKYFGIFEDVSNAKDFDWCSYILDWLIDGIKSFTCAKGVGVSDGGTLTGCFYYLAVSLPVLYIFTVPTTCYDSFELLILFCFFPVRFFILIMWILVLGKFPMPFLRFLFGRVTC
jgi:hypothetical protein